MTSGCGGGSVMPMTTAFASPRLMASTAILSATPNDAHAATGANAGPTMRPIIDTCDAGMLAMFHSRFGDTAAHGSSGQPHFLFSARTLFNFCRIVLSFADPDDGGTGSDRRGLRLRLDLGRVPQVLQERLAVPAPELSPRMLRVAPIFAAGGEFTWIPPRHRCARATRRSARAPPRIRSTCATRGRTRW